MTMPLLIVFPFIISVIMLIWFKSEALIDYANLFGLSKFLKEKEFKEEQLNNPLLNYPMFLKMKYNKFFFKLIGCRLCFNVWLSGILSLFISYSIFSFISYTCILCISSLFIFGITSKLLNEN